MSVQYNYGNFDTDLASTTSKDQHHGVSSLDNSSQKQNNRYELHLEFIDRSDGNYVHPIFDVRTIIAINDRCAVELAIQLISLVYSTYQVHQVSLRQYESYGEIKFAKHMTQFDLSL